MTKEIKVKLVTIRGQTPGEEFVAKACDADYSNRLGKLKDSGAPLSYLDPGIDRSQVFIIREENEGTS